MIYVLMFFNERSSKIMNKAAKHKQKEEQAKEMENHFKDILLRNDKGLNKNISHAHNATSAALKYKF